MGAPAMASKYALYSQVFPARKRKGKKPIPPCRVDKAFFQNAKPIGAGQRITQNDKPVVIVVFQPAQTAADKLVLPGGNVFFQCRRQRPEWEKNGSGILLQLRPTRGTWRSHIRL